MSNSRSRWRVEPGTRPPLDAIDPSWSWLNPFGAGGAALTSGLLLGVFAYWGWESAVNLSEETTDGDSAPGRAAMWSTVVLLVTPLVLAAVGLLALLTFQHARIGEGGMGIVYEAEQREPHVAEARSRPHRFCGRQAGDRPRLDPRLHAQAARPAAGASGAAPAAFLPRRGG